MVSLFADMPVISATASGPALSDSVRNHAIDCYLYVHPPWKFHCGFFLDGTCHSAFSADLSCI